MWAIFHLKLAVISSNVSGWPGFQSQLSTKYPTLIISFVGLITFSWILKLGKFSGWMSYAYSTMKREIDLNSDGNIWEEKENKECRFES